MELFDNMDLQSVITSPFFFLHLTFPIRKSFSCSACHCKQRLHLNLQSTLNVTEAGHKTAVAQGLRPVITIIFSFSHQSVFCKMHSSAIEIEGIPGEEQGLRSKCEQI